MEQRNKIDNSYNLIAVYLIIKKYANAQNPIAVKEISKHLRETFLLEKNVDNRTIKEHINRIIDLNERFGIADELLQVKGEDGVTRYYFVEVIDEPMVRMMSDIIASSKYIDGEYGFELIETLHALNGYEVPNFFRTMLAQKDMKIKPNPEVFLSVETLEKAIAENKKVSLHYLKYDTDYRLVDRDEDDERIVCVYKVVWTAEYYYAMCRFEDSGNIYFMRVDKMRGVKLTDEELPQLPPDFDAIKYLSTQPYLFGGTPQRISFCIDKQKLDQVIDRFGDAVTIRDLGNCCKVELDSSIEMMHVWLLQYSPYITNIHPESLKNLVIDSLQTALRKNSY